MYICSYIEQRNFKSFFPLIKPNVKVPALFTYNSEWFQLLNKCIFKIFVRKCFILFLKKQHFFKIKIYVCKEIILRMLFAQSDVELPYLNNKKDQ